MNFLPKKTVGYILLTLIFIAFAVVFFIFSKNEPTKSNIPLKWEYIGTALFFVVFAIAALIRAFRHYKNVT